MREHKIANAEIFIVVPFVYICPLNKSEILKSARCGFSLFYVDINSPQLIRNLQYVWHDTSSIDLERKKS